MHFAHTERAIPQAAQIHILTLMLNKLTERETEERLSEHGVPLTVPQVGAMRAIYHNPGLTQSELSRRMMLAPATLVPILDALEKHGMARRNRDESDRRRTLISLTTAGETLLQEFPSLHQDTALSRAIEAMGPEKARQLVDHLRELVERLAGDDPVARHVLARLDAHSLPDGPCRAGDKKKDG